jgi:hypothetical protein
MAAQAISAGVASSGAGETSTSSLMYNSDQSHFTRNIKLFTMPVCSDRQNSSRLTRVGRQTRSTTWRSLLLACCQMDYARWSNKWWIGSQVSNQYSLNSWTINAWCRQIKMSHSWGLSVIDYCWKVGCGHKRPARANEKDESLPDTTCPDRTHTDASECSVTYVAIVDEWWGSHVRYWRDKPAVDVPRSVRLQNWRHHMTLDHFGRLLHAKCHCLLCFWLWMR